jgi:hypothetical protein
VSVSDHPARPYDARLQAALVSCSTVKEAAAAAGVSYATARRRLADPEFRGQREAWQRKVLADASLDLLELTVEAVELQRRLMTDDETPAATRRLLIRDALEFGLRYVEAGGLAEAVAELQRALGVDPRTGQRSAA